MSFFFFNFLKLCLVKLKILSVCVDYKVDDSSVSCVDDKFKDLFCSCRCGTQSPNLSQKCIVISELKVYSVFVVGP